MREQLSPGVEIYDEYLDLGRFSGPDRSAQLARYFAEKYQRVRPDAIVAEGTPALRFVIDRLRGLFPEIPVVYGGAFEPALDFSSLPDNVVGRRQLLPFASTYSLAHALQPRAERFLLVGGASLGDSVLIVEAQRQITPLLTGTQMQVYQDWSPTRGSSTVFVTSPSHVRAAVGLLEGPERTKVHPRGPGRESGTSSGIRYR